MRFSARLSNLACSVEAEGEHHWDFSVAEPPRRQQPLMAADDAAVGASYDDRLHEAELPDAPH